jgi:hypothetical protein
VNSISNLTRSPGDPRLLRSGPGSQSGTDRLTRALGWISFAIGASELFAAGPIARALGMEGKENLLRACGAREIGAGMLTLSTEKELGLWSRSAGDGLDLALLISARRSDNPQRQNVGAALGLVTLITALDLFAASQLRAGRARGREWRRYDDRSGFPLGVRQARGAGRRRPQSAGTEASSSRPQLVTTP